MPFKNAQTLSVESNKEKEIKDRLNKLQSDLDANLKVVNEIEDKTAILESINKDIIKAKSQLKDLKSDINDSDNNFFSLEKTIQSKREEITQMNFDRCLLKEEYEQDIDNHKKQLNDEVKLIEGKIKKLEKNRLEIFKEIEELKEDSNKLNCSFLSLIDEKNNIDEFIKENKGILDDIMKNKLIEVDVNKSLANIKTKIQEAFSILSGLETDIAIKTEAKTHLSKDILELQSKKAQIETEMIERESLVSQREFSTNEKEKKIKLIINQLRVISPERMVNINM